MRLWIFFDLHQEWPENAWDPAARAPAGGFDVAVVAGDVHRLTSSTVAPFPASRRTKAICSFLKRLRGMASIRLEGSGCPKNSRSAWTVCRVRIKASPGKRKIPGQQRSSIEIWSSTSYSEWKPVEDGVITKGSHFDFRKLLQT